MHLAGHAGRYLPLGDRARVDERLVDPRSRSVHVSADAGRGHLSPSLRLVRAWLMFARWDPHIGPKLGHYQNAADGPVQTKVGSTPIPPKDLRQIIGKVTAAL